MEKREVWKVIVFGLITLGIYDLYWLYKTREELVAKGAQIPRFIILLLPTILLLAAALVSMIILLATATPTTVNGTATFESDNTPAASIPFFIIMGLGALAYIPITLWWLYRYSQGVELATKGEVSKGLSFFMAIVLGVFSVSFVWPGFIQDAFNKVKPANPAKHAKKA
jgi:hypothetical protein